jgi:Tfp pilus assembly protein PilF
MAEQSRRQQIEAMLLGEPDDTFLRYALAMEQVKEGDAAAAVQSFEKLLTTSRDYVPGYFQYGQFLVRVGRPEEARQVLRRGIDAAKRTGDDHAAEEMQGVLLSLA